MIPSTQTLHRTMRIKATLLARLVDVGVVVHEVGADVVPCDVSSSVYSNYRNYAPPLDVKGGIITEKVFPVFSESFFWTCFGLVMYIWVLMDVTEKLAFQM